MTSILIFEQRNELEISNPFKAAKPLFCMCLIKSEGTKTKANVWQVLQLKYGCSNNLKHCVRSLEASRKSFKVIAQKQKKFRRQLDLRF